MYKIRGSARSLPDPKVLAAEYAIILDEELRKHGHRRTENTLVRIQLKGKLRGATKTSTATFGDIIPKVMSNDNLRGVIYLKGEEITPSGSIGIKIWIKP